jgi:predicted nuclease of predicted toxin-antitoxin system
VKILLDACVWGKAKERLAQEGHDIIWVGDWTEDPGDLEILERAHREGRLLVTLDKDFGELAIVRRVRHSGIVRLVGISARMQADVCLQVLNRYSELLLNGAILTVESNRVRIRPAD